MMPQNLEIMVHNKCLYYVYIFLIILSGCSHNYRIGRSKFRTYSTKLPEVSASGEDSKTKYTCISSHYAHYPIFGIFDEDYFLKHSLPEYIILNNDTHMTVDRVTLENQIESLITEVKEHKKTFTHFTVVQRKNFNRKQCCGLLVVKCKEYPFIVKLFMETPKTFINPYCKGIEPISFFFMAGGSNRHIAGLTRIKNLENINKKIATLSMKNITLHTPRKWFWKPQHGDYIVLQGKYIIPDTILTARIPALYAIIADEINTTENVIIPSAEREKIVLNICKTFNFTLDPHTTNYVFNKNQETGMYRIDIIDTEHFPSMVGAITDYNFQNYTSWYTYLVCKFLHNTFGRLKNEQQELIIL